MTKIGKIGHLGIGAMAALTAGMAANMLVARPRPDLGDSPIPGSTSADEATFMVFGNADPEIEALLREVQAAGGPVFIGFDLAKPDPGHDYGVEITDWKAEPRPKRKFKHNRRG